jgi:hypothetical protein
MCISHVIKKIDTYISLLQIRLEEISPTQFRGKLCPIKTYGFYL